MDKIRSKFNSWELDRKWDTVRRNRDSRDKYYDKPSMDEVTFRLNKDGMIMGIRL